MLYGSVEHLMNGEWVKFSQGDLLAVGEEDFHAIRGSSFSYANLILPVSFRDSWVNGLGLDDPHGSPRTCGELTVNIAPDMREEFAACASGGPCGSNAFTWRASFSGTP